MTKVLEHNNTKNGAYSRSNNILELPNLECISMGLRHESVFPFVSDATGTIKCQLVINFTKTYWTFQLLKERITVIVAF